MEFKTEQSLRTTTYIKNSGLSTQFKASFVNLSSVVSRKVSA
jgi:hypothetical protein